MSGRKFEISIAHIFKSMGYETKICKQGGDEGVNIEIFKDELKILTEDTPILIALGDDSYDILKKNLSGEYEIVKIKHYSYRNLNKEEYRKAVLDVLKVL